LHRREPFEHRESRHRRGHHHAQRLGQQGRQEVDGPGVEALRHRLQTNLHAGGRQRGVQVAEPGHGAAEPREDQGLGEGGAGDLVLPPLDKTGLVRQPVGRDAEQLVQDLRHLGTNGHRGFSGVCSLITRQPGEALDSVG
jgi:hypothetical protein